MNDDDRSGALSEDLDLAGAFRSVRDVYDGTNAESNLTLQRALFRTRARERRRSFARWVVLPAAAVLVASTAWAGVTGRLTPALSVVLESLHAERTPPAAHDAATASAGTPRPSNAEPASEPRVAPAPASAELAPEPAAAPSLAVEPPLASAPSLASEPSLASAPSRAAEPPRKGASAALAPPSTASSRSPTATASRAAEPAAAAAPSASVDSAAAAPSASASDPHAALFAEAHRLHFTERDPARALAAWDRYLAVAPDGRFSPEARYNRALALVRLGRHAEATSELAAFARGAYGSYRRDDAQSLLDALARDASSP